jgi:hypothetical protein
MEDFKNLDKVTFVYNEQPDCEEFVGKTISKIELFEEGDGYLVISFEDYVSLKIADKGRDCCESRYMHCEDESDFEYHEGAIFRGCSQASYEDCEGDYDEVHEKAFFNILTSKGVIQLVTHNDHNGYYGGFNVQFEKGV